MLVHNKSVNYFIILAQKFKFDKWSIFNDLFLTIKEISC